MKDIDNFYFLFKNAKVNIKQDIDKGAVSGYPTMSAYHVYQHNQNYF